MPKESSVLTAEKSPKYQAMLAKHFARKVEVEMNEDDALVHFPMGRCLMQVRDTDLHFHCEADSQEALNAIKGIVDGHMHLLKDVRDTKLQWRS